MEEARRVFDRLRRIELLEREGAEARHLLAEVEALLVEAEAWRRAERGATGGAARALECCRAALAERRVPVPTR